MFALVTAFTLPTQRQRVIQHRPMTDSETAYVTPMLAAILPLATQFNDACVAAIQAANEAATASSRTVGVVTVEEGGGEGEGEGGPTIDTTDVEAVDGATSTSLIKAFEAASGPHPYLPLHLHVALVRALFSYERWAEFRTFLVTAEVRRQRGRDQAAAAAAPRPPPSARRSPPKCWAMSCSCCEPCPTCTPGRWWRTFPPCRGPDP